MRGYAFFCVVDSDGNIVRAGIVPEGDVKDQTTSADADKVALRVSRRVDHEQDLWKIDLRGETLGLERRTVPRFEESEP